LGVPPQVIAIVAPLHLFAQFWYHTRHIGKMDFLEKIIVTPSIHRVHHAINPEYLDKNYGQIFIIWDKLFKTYQDELDNVPAVYGVTRPVQTWNPVKINFMHLWLLIKDAWRAEKWADKFKIWFMPLGWRPEDVAKKYPVHKIENVYQFEKYNPQLTRGMLIWSFGQLIALLLLLSYLGGFLFRGLCFLDRLCLHRINGSQSKRLGLGTLKSCLCHVFCGQFRRLVWIKQFASKRYLSIYHLPFGLTILFSLVFYQKREVPIS
jgi:hypothetical protein